MPQLTHNDIALLSAQLLRLQEVTLGAVRQRLHQSGNGGEPGLANHVAEVREQPQADLLGDTDLAQLKLELVELRSIEEALERMKEGTFGVCMQCGSNISLRRLRAAPAARRCLGCQEALELHRRPTGR